MLDVSSEWINKIIGMNPNKTVDESYWDIEPITGIS